MQNPQNKQSETPLCIPRDIMMQAAMMRLGSIDDQIQAGYEILRKYHRTVTIFGSARLEEDSPYYQAAYDTAYKLAKADYAVVSGGGHGIMGAANKGARDAGGDSIGFNIHLPHEQTLNEYTTDAYAFSHFAPRKIVMTMFANAYIYFPGGFGTLDELAEIITLVQTGKTTKAPLILYGSEFWDDLDDMIKQTMLDDMKLISNGDEQLYTITDDVDEVVRLVKANQTYCDHPTPNIELETPRDAKAT